MAIRMLRTQISHPLGLSPPVECLKPARIKLCFQSKTLFDQVFSRAGDLFGQLAAFQIEGKTDSFLERLFPRTERQIKDKLEPERWTRIKSVLDDPRVTPIESRNTLWALYNAVVHEEDYRASREAGPEARLSRIWFGSGQALKIKALEEAEKLAKATA